MAEKDMTTKQLEWYNDVFADILNVLLFDGKRVVAPQELTAAEKESHYKADGRIRSQERDVLKYWKRAGISLALFGTENQVEMEKWMPIRVLSYDGSEYRKQIQKNQESFYPVITLVIYFGREPWKYGTNLHSCLTIPDELLPYVSDYRMNLVSMKDLTEEQIGKFQSDFRVIAEFFKALNNGETYQPTDKMLEHPEETLDMISVFSGDDRFRDAYNELNITGGVSMCRIYDDIIEQGIEQGIEKGIRQEKVNGIKKAIIMLKNVGATVDMIITNLVSEYSLSQEEAAARVKDVLAQMS